MKLPSTGHTDTWRHPVVLVGIGMAALQIVFRAWALYPSWFFADDYVLLHDALGTPVTSGYLFSDFNSNLIPAVRLLASLVVGSGELNWPLAATIVLILQALANVAALTMLTSLFGPRWALLAPFALYLSSAVTMPAFMWWVAAVSQLPFQAAFFLAVTAWVAYLRTHRWRWLAVTILVLIISLFCYTKSVLIGPVLAYVAIAYFAEGDLRRRVVTCLRRYWAAAVLGGAVTAAYVVYYVTQVPQPFENPDRGQFADVIETVLGSSFPTSLLGGPWRWWDTTPPVVLASPPDWAVSLSWVLIAGIVAYSVLTRSRVVAGWILLFAYATGLGLLLASSRGQLYGQLSGLEYRYLTDVICVATLSLALVFLPLLGAPGASRPREQLLLLVAPRPGVVIGIVAAISIGGVLSTARYVNFWHTSNASREYVHNLQRDLEETPRTSTGRPGDAGGRHARLHNSGEHDRSLHPAARGGDVVPRGPPTSCSSSMTTATSRRPRSGPASRPGPAPWPTVDGRSGPPGGPSRSPGRRSTTDGG